MTTVESTIARFEEAYRLGQRPRIDDYLASPADGDERLHLLVELVHTELELRLKAGETVRTEEYLARFTALAEDDSIVLGLLHSEFWHRQRRGENVAYTEYHRRFPRLVGRLEAMSRHADALAASLLSCQTIISTRTRQLNSGPNPPSNGRGLSGDLALAASVPLGVLRVLRGYMNEREFAEGEHLLRQGDVGTSLMILCEGTVDIRVDDGAGDQHQIATIDAGRILGEMSLLTDEPCTASAVATSPVRALTLPAKQFHALAKRYPILADALTEIVAERLGGFTHDVLSGKTFFDCSIKRRLGRGGMSIVYEAEHLPTARRVALKMLSHRLVNDSDARALFEREADLIAGFAHPHIIRTFGRFAAFGTYFTILEFAPGESLQETIERRGALPEVEVRAIVAQVANALAYAHARQVLHRDLKPSNIMLGPDGHARLTDFGLALSLDVLVAEEPGRLVGTPQYMSPEQLAGQPLTTAADHFGLACVVYEMLIGQPLFPENTLAALLQRHRGWTSPAFGELCPAASGELCRLLETSLHRDPRERQLDLDRLSTIDR